MKTGRAGIDLIKQWEGFSATVYKDITGKATIGFGTLIDTDEEKYLIDKIVSRIEAEQLLLKELAKIDYQLKRMILAPINQNQWDALASWCYNFGSARLRSSTLLIVINANPTDPAIKAEWAKWNKAGGKVVAGLVDRRKAEIDLYFKPIDMA